MCVQANLDNLIVQIKLCGVFCRGCFAVCYSVLQCVPVYCSVLQCVTVRSVYCSVMQCDAV